jgi:hypothetical protein
MKLAALLGDVAKPPVTARPPLLGGHILTESSYEGVKQWRCITCKASTLKWCELAPAKCRGSAAEKWALASVAAAEAGGSVGPGHHRMLAGETVWCLKCGCYGGDRARGLADVCRGKPTDKSGGGLAGQLSYLMKGLHPGTRKQMPESIDENGRIFKPGGLSLREAIEDRPCTVQPVVSAGGNRGSSTSGFCGRTSAQKLKDKLERVRNSDREKAKAARSLLPSMRRLRGKQAVGGV